MAGVDDDDTFDGEDPDIMAAFLQLQHSHKMLLREKEEVERYCMDMEETRQDKERVITQLRAQNNKLSRELGNAKMTSEQLAAHLQELEEQRQRAAAKRPGRSVELAQELQHGNFDEVDMAAPPSTPPPVEPTTLATDALQCLVTDQENLIRVLRRKQRVYQQEIRNLRDQITELEASASHLAVSSPINNMSLLDSLEGVDTDRAEHIVLAEPQSGKAVVVNARKHMQHQQTLEQRINLSQAEIVQKDTEVKSLRDELDVALAKLEDAERELEHMRRTRADPDFDVSLHDELQGPGIFKGMTLEEQTRIITERVEFKLEVEQLKEAVVDATLLASKWQWREQTMRVYTRERDKSIYQILEKPLSKKQRLKFLRLLKKTALNDLGDDDGTLPPMMLT